MFSLALRFSANDDSENAKMNGANDQLGPLCKVTGGRSHTGSSIRPEISGIIGQPVDNITKICLVNSPKNLLESLHLIGQKIQSSSGVMVNFERLPESPSNGRPELGNSNEPKPWHNTTGMVNVRQNYKTRNFQGYWPIPESFWADPNEPKCPPRYATPTLKFSSKGERTITRKVEFFGELADKLLFQIASRCAFKTLHLTNWSLNPRH